jgi:SAM-dependent methyltransferase
MSTIDYDHHSNAHTGDAARVIVPLVLEIVAVSSVLDIGSGMGDWLLEFSRNGIEDYMGIDGIGIETRFYRADPSRFQQVDLRQQWDLGRRFDLAVCLEVAEHLPATCAGVLLKNIVQHSDRILFSAAVPHQPGQGHLNCQPPDYWQEKFNQLGFICTDPFRAQFWNTKFSEYWYKQNLFLATRVLAGYGQEPRLAHLVHPDLLEVIVNQSADIIANLESHNARLASQIAWLTAEREKTLAILQGRAGARQSLRSAAGIILKTMRGGGGNTKA